MDKWMMYRKSKMNEGKSKMNEGKKQIRSNNTQLRKLVQIMSEDPKFANADYAGPLGAKQMAARWEEVQDILNELGPEKNIIQWKQTWRDLKRKFRRESAAEKEMEGEDVVVEDVVVEAESPNFTLIMRSCTALLRSLGRAAERVIDHAAFQQILALTSLTAAERARVTGQAVRAAMDDDHDYCAEIDMDALGEAGEGDEFPVPMVIKDEVEVTHWQCSCDAIAGRHDDACDAAVVDYLEHFRISPDEATCTICEETLTWTSVETLKEHLSTHPEAAGGDHEDDSDIHPTQEKQAKINQPIIQKPPPPPSPPIMKIPKDVKIIPQNDTPLAETPPANKKRKIEPIEDNEPITIKHDPSTLDRFKSLDQFGLYVASLLKLLPKDKCIKYQNQIVDRLLKDQAAAA
ncbi:uncharacterized protein LOC105388478 isoform X3 [Plutella xylostella]|uniref:uncharacterized protein LOC105388478 isoform X3 n=1 Tax=Plutella xylostella TaxID=51655 RepID=UPI002032AFBC|nr:uncharacterized protein LOC105388478 isoform X3 [Plutella xylostella]